MDAEVTIPKPKNLSLAEAATIGVGSEVLFHYLESLGCFLRYLTIDGRSWRVLWAETPGS
jgi:NADPH:quinone reductase-like Zn-dependent oxidoreductase